MGCNHQEATRKRRTQGAMVEGWWSRGRRWSSSPESDPATALLALILIILTASVVLSALLQQFRREGQADGHLLVAPGRVTQAAHSRLGFVAAKAGRHPWNLNEYRANLFQPSRTTKPVFAIWDRSKRILSCNAQESQLKLHAFLRKLFSSSAIDVSDEADIEVRLFILLQQLRIRHKVAVNKGQEEVAKEMIRSIKELEGLIEERDNRWAPEAMDELRDQLDAQLRTNGPETLRRNLFRKIEAIMNPTSDVKFKLGSKVIHKEKRYTGVVCGYHPGCRETDEWVESNGILRMLGATARPFYMVLVDVRDVNSPVVTYVPEAMLEQVLNHQGDCKNNFTLLKIQEQQKKPPEVVHPFVYSLFYGQNPNGDYLPTNELMRRYGENRE